MRYFYTFNCEVYHCVEHQCKTKGNIERVTFVKLHHFLFCDCLKNDFLFAKLTRWIPSSSKNPDDFFYICGSFFMRLGLWVYKSLNVLHTYNTPKVTCLIASQWGLTIMENLCRIKFDKSFNELISKMF